MAHVIYMMVYMYVVYVAHVMVYMYVVYVRVCVVCRGLVLSTRHVKVTK
jgi:hypothetical protein